MTQFFSSSDPVIGQHLNHYRQALAGSLVKLSELENTFLSMWPLIHGEDGYNYASARLPEAIASVKKIIISSSLNIEPFVFDIKNSKAVYSPARRRQIYLDSKNVLFVLLNSYSDLDDLINCLISYRLTKPEFNPILELLPVNEADFVSQVDTFWQENINRSLYLDLINQPVYFISSNTHSLANIIGGFLNKKQNYIFDYVAHKHPKVYDAWFFSKSTNHRLQVNDILYYLATNFLKDNSQFTIEKNSYEASLGIINLPSQGLIPIDLQIIPVSSLAKSTAPDSNLSVPDVSQSNAVIINIQYPLGVAAKYLLDSFFKHFKNIKGIYIVGKAAILNGSVGDIQIPNVILDEVTNNIYKFDNIFNSFFPHRGVVSQILQNQKSACVYGTLLENQNQIENYKKSNFNIIEMESGNYLASILEYYQLHEAVSNSFVYQLKKLPIDLGIINYASDNPLTENLSEESVDFRGIETTYLSSLNVLSRILELQR